MSPQARRTEGQPHDRLTRLAGVMADALEADPQSEGVKSIIMLDDDVTRQGGMVIQGYDDDRDAIVRMFEHLAAIFETRGQTLTIVGTDTVGQG